MKKNLLLLNFAFCIFSFCNAQTAPAIQCQNTIGGSVHDNLCSVQQTPDGGYILGGNSLSNISGDKTENSNGSYDFWIIKTDSLGNIQWQNSIGGSSGDYFRSSENTADGGYVLGGGSGSDISGDKTENCIGFLDYWIVKLGPAPTGVQSELQNPKFEITISPNPATDKIYISFPATASEKITIKIYSITGEVVLEKESKSTAPITNYQLPITNISNGIYFLSVQTGSEMVTGKIVVNH